MDNHPSGRVIRQNQNFGFSLFINKISSKRVDKYGSRASEVDYPSIKFPLLSSYFFGVKTLFEKLESNIAATRPETTMARSNIYDVSGSAKDALICEAED